MSIQLTTPLIHKNLSQLKSGDQVKLSGTIYTARDIAHQKIIEFLEKNRKLPFDLKNNIIYYTGPSPTPPGQIIGACGSTTSYRMDPFTIPLLKAGIIMTIGKGERSNKIRTACQKYKSIYAITVGGSSAYLTQFVKSNKIIAFPEITTGAVRQLVVEDFPIIIAYDLEGNSSYPNK